MNKLLLTALAAVSLTGLEASADVTIKLPANSGVDSVEYQYAPIKKIVTAKTRAERGMVSGKVAVADNQAKVPVDPAIGDYQFSAAIAEGSFLTMFGEPGEECVAVVSSVSPFEYELTQNRLHASTKELDDLLKPIQEKSKALRSAGEPKHEEMQALQDEFSATVKEYIEENPTSPSVVYAVLQLSGEDLIKEFDRLSERAKTSILYPIAEYNYNRTKERMEMDRRQQEMANGSTPAPGFTLKDLEGKDVSLSEFKGKWVILDFWGSWCIWCIKGFPELKEAYAKYKDRLEVIGIDCNETEEAWKAGVAKYELPWVNVYCPKGNQLFKDYGIQAFPTKAIIDPEGKIRNITTGHDPEFFTILDNLLAR